MAEYLDLVPLTAVQPPSNASHGKAFRDIKDPATLSASVWGATPRTPKFVVFMIYITLLLATFLLPTQTPSETQKNFKTRVAQQVARIKLMAGHSEFGNGELPGITLPDDNGPVTQLIKYGMEAVPELVPYLADDSFTQACRTHSSGWTERARVNEYILVVINRITEHNFYLPVKQSEAARLAGATVDPAIPKDVAELQRQIDAWWAANRTRPLLDRKIDDVNDPVHENRFLAYEWLGRNRAEAGRLPLERRIETLLTGEVNTLKQSEMAACAESLARIGQIQSADTIRKVCDHLSYSLYMSYRPLNEGRSGHGSTQLLDLFKAHHALASLGFKPEALSRLQELKVKYYGEMDPSTQQEFVRNFEAAEKW